MAYRLYGIESILHRIYTGHLLNSYLRCIAHNSYGIFVRTYRLNIKLDEKPLEAIDQLVPGGVPSISQPPIESNPELIQMHSKPTSKVKSFI